jgi:hypothetical protein
MESNADHEPPGAMIMIDLFGTPGASLAGVVETLHRWFSISYPLAVSASGMR